MTTTTTETRAELLASMREKLAEFEREPERLEEGEYVHTQQALVLFATMIARLPLGAMLAQISRTETLGPLLDPTLYLKGIDKLERVKELARCAQGLRAEVIRQARIEIAALERQAGVG